VIIGAIENDHRVAKIDPSRDHAVATELEIEACLAVLKEEETS
jgi:hypothetical protein